MNLRDLTRIQWAGAIGFAGLTVALSAYAIAWSPAVPFLTRSASASWIGYPASPGTRAMPSSADATVFSKGFVVERPTTAEIELQALRESDLELDGAPIALPGDGDSSWRSTRRSDVTLDPGAHELRVRVVNPRGPALLRLRLEADGIRVASDRSWRVARAGLDERAADVADDTRPNPDAYASPRPTAALVRHALALALVFVTAALASIAGRRYAEPWVRTHGVHAAWIAAVVVWIAFLLFKVLPLRPGVGFDLEGHLAYVRIVALEGRVPWPDEGWSTYHPPLFYVLSAGLLAVAGSDLGLVSPDGAGWLRAISWLGGLAGIWAAYRCARELFGQDRTAVAYAVLVAFSIPMNWTMSAYVSNEALHAGLVGLALVPACRMLRVPNATVAQAAACGALLGLAMSTKFTALLVAPVVLVSLALKLGYVESATPARGARVLSAAAGAAAVAGGGFYLRNWIALGRPVVGNWELDWWQHPGFHTASYYLGFGEVLRRPFFSGFRSFWDGVYSTFWGDGLLGGVPSFRARHEAWNYDYQALVYLVAIPATVIGAVGFGLALRRALRGRDGGQRLAWSMMTALIYGVGFAVFYLTLRLPFYAQAKAFYGLCLMVPLSLVGASGLAAVHRATAAPGRVAWRAVFHGWLGVLLYTILRSFFG